MQLRLSNALRMNEELRNKSVKNLNASSTSPEISYHSSDLDIRGELSQQQHQSSAIPVDQQEYLSEHHKEDIQVLATK